jgi:hypothetical protein
MLCRHCGRSTDRLYCCEAVSRVRVPTDVREAIASHPDTSPDYYPRDLNALINNPSSASRTSSFIRFREFLLQEIERRPDHQYYRDFLVCIDEVLRWRATVPPELRFWRADR